MIFAYNRCSIHLNSHWPCRGFVVLFMLNVFIYVYWYPTRLPYQMMFLSFNRNTTGTTNGTGTTYPPNVLEFTPSFSGVRAAQSLVFCVVYCRSLLVILFVILWPLFCLFFYFAAFYHVFVIFKLFLYIQLHFN